jgi:hypothetical protein
MELYNTYAKLLDVEPHVIAELDAQMARRTGKTGALKSLEEKRRARLESIFESLQMPPQRSADEVTKELEVKIFLQEKKLHAYVAAIPGANEFEKAASLARRIAKPEKGFFLKKEFAREIMLRRPPEKLLQFMGCSTVEELLAKHDVTECFSSLRFIESNAWMHQTFEEAYSTFTPADFEEREVELRVLGPQWREVAEKFVAKKNHNVSHLKEFGVIFLNPIKEGSPGKFLRDFALLLHYFHEVSYYSKLFRKYAAEDQFAEKLKMLLRGDVKEAHAVKSGEWLIVQRYLAKENPDDPRLFIPRVNPEVLHWSRGERDLVNFADTVSDLNMHLWADSCWVGEVRGGQLISFDLEDNAMSAVGRMGGKTGWLTYHQREALWTRIFEEYAGGEDAMERLLIENFERGIIAL